MTIRRSLAVLLAAGLALGAAACSDDAGGEEGSGSSSSTTEAPETTTTTIADDEYFAAIDDAEASLAAAGSDLCAVSTATQTLPPPGNPAQVERALDVYRATYEAAAAALEPDDPTSAAALREAVDALINAAEEADYSTEFLDGENPPAALTSEEFQNASQALQAKYNEECAQQAAPGAPEAPESTEAPEAAPEG